MPVDITPVDCAAPLELPNSESKNTSVAFLAQKNCLSKQSK